MLFLKYCPLWNRSIHWLNFIICECLWLAKNTIKLPYAFFWNLHYKSTSHIIFYSIYYTTKCFSRLKINIILKTFLKVKRGQKVAKWPKIFLRPHKTKKGQNRVIWPQKGQYTNPGRNIKLHVSHLPLTELLTKNSNFPNLFKNSINWRHFILKTLSENL